LELGESGVGSVFDELARLCVALELTLCSLEALESPLLDKASRLSGCACLSASLLQSSSALLSTRGEGGATKLLLRETCAVKAGARSSMRVCVCEVAEAGELG
jgi:hypothetical protein